MRINNDRLYLELSWGPRSDWRILGGHTSKGSPQLLVRFGRVFFQIVIARRSGTQ
jgi:hypothetical protein